MVIEQLIDSQLFHLISMLFCIGIVVWLLVRHYSHSESQKEDDRIWLLNTLYISGILTFIVIELITAICMGNTNKADILSFVSFAATLSSLILSVVAIIFTIVSGNRGEKQIQKLDSVSDNVKESLERFTEKTESIDLSVDKFKEVADGLSEEMHKILEKISGMEEPIRMISTQMLSSGGSFKESDSKTKDGVIEESFKSHISSFIFHSSFSGNLALYACVLSKEKNHPFSMEEIGENNDDEAYKFGYIIASVAMGVISAQLSGERVVNVLDYYEGLKDLLEQAIRVYIEGAKTEVEKQTNKDRFEKIKSLFK